MLEVFGILLQQLGAIYHQPSRRGHAGKHCICVCWARVTRNRRIRSGNAPVRDWTSRTVAPRFRPRDGLTVALQPVANGVYAASGATPLSRSFYVSWVMRACPCALRADGTPILLQTPPPARSFLRDHSSRAAVALASTRISCKRSSVKPSSCARWLTLSISVRNASRDEEAEDAASSSWRLISAPSVRRRSGLASLKTRAASASTSTVIHSGHLVPPR